MKVLWRTLWPAWWQWCSAWPQISSPIITTAACGSWRYSAAAFSSLGSSFSRSFLQESKNRFLFYFNLFLLCKHCKEKFLLNYICVFNFKDPTTREWLQFEMGRGGLLRGSWDLHRFHSKLHCCHGDLMIEMTDLFDKQATEKSNQSFLFFIIIVCSFTSPLISPDIGNYRISHDSYFDINTVNAETFTWRNCLLHIFRSFDDSKLTYNIIDSKLWWTK